MFTAIIGMYATIPWRASRVFQNVVSGFFVCLVFVTVSCFKVDMFICPVLESHIVSFCATCAFFLLVAYTLLYDWSNGQVTLICILTVLDLCKLWPISH